jgi:hypothetical protein
MLRSSNEAAPIQVLRGMSGDPFASVTIMAFGAISFFLGNLFAQAREGLTDE